MRKEYFDLYYDLSDQSFMYLGNRMAKPFQIPVYIMMSTSEFRQYSRKNMELRVDEKLLDIYLNRADDFTRMLVDYKLAVIEVNDAELKDAVDIFSRVNSKGTDISYDWMVNALSYDNNFSFSNEIDNLIISLQKYNFEGLSRNSLFRCYQSAFDEKSYIDNTEIEKMVQRSDFVDVVKKTTPAIERTIAFLYNELCVVDAKLLPYPTQLIFIMRVFMQYPELDKKQKNELKRWFWITTYSNYFTIYNLSSQRRAFDLLMKYLKGESDTMLYNESRTPFKVSALPQRIQLSAVRSKALYLFELNYYANKTGKWPSTNSELRTFKIDKFEPTVPANMIPYFSDSIELYGVGNPSNNQDINKFCHFFIENIEDTIPEILSKRFLAIKKAEKTFVERLGMKLSD